MGIMFASSFAAIFPSKENFEIMGSTVVGFFFYYFVVLAPITAAHEISHGIALRHYGGTPGELGTGLYFFGPMFYVETTDSWTLNRYQRIMISASGFLVELTIASGIMIVQYLFQFPPFASHVLTMAVFYVFYGVLINLSPLLETDGYFILSDSLKIPDLRAKSFTYLKAQLMKIFRKPVDKAMKKLTKKTKAILLAYAILAAVWAVYLIYRSATMAVYMAQDTVTSGLNVSSGLLSNSLTITAVALSVASVLYFSMVMSGYGLLIFTGLKKALKTSLQLEEIHDRELAVFMYVPRNVSKSAYSALREKVAKAARSYTDDFTVHKIGPICIADLKMSHAKLAFVQIKEHFENIEEKFDKIYGGFLRRHESKILRTVGVNDPQKKNLAVVLSQMASQMSTTGTEAKEMVSKIIDRQARNALYLLHSAYGKVWAIELSPKLLNEYGETLQPSLLLEDLSVTNLYGDLERFKKRIVYGFDTLAKLAVDNQNHVQEALRSPEKHQIICSFEPMKSRFIFVGRTQPIGKMIDSFTNLFVSQVWCGYLDNLLSEVNLSLLSLNQTSLPDRKSLESMKDGELAVLDKNLSLLIDHKEPVRDSWRNSKKHIESTNREIKEIEKDFKEVGRLEIEEIEATLKVNAENLANLPTQLWAFSVLSQTLFKSLQGFEKSVKKEFEKRKVSIQKKKRKRLALFPIFIALSVVLALLGIWGFSGYAATALVIIASLIQVSFWTTYLSFTKSLGDISRYPTLAFRQAHFFTFALTESLYEFMATSDFLTPVEQDTTRTKEKTET
jgi:hypothetical protein